MYVFAIDSSNTAWKVPFGSKAIFYLPPFLPRRNLKTKCLLIHINIKNLRLPATLDLKKKCLQVQQSSQSSTETETPTSHSQKEQSSSQPVQQSDQQSSFQTFNPPNNETLTVAVDQSHSSAQASTTNEQAQSPSQNQRSSCTAAVNRPHKTSQTKRKRVEQNETLTALQRLENIATAINNPGSNEKQKDEFYYFGQCCCSVKIIAIK